MPNKDSEPKLLRIRKGKDFHEKVQKVWVEMARAKKEKPITKPSKKKGRIDIFVESDETLVAVVEIKASDWDKMTSISVHRNIKRQARQIWDYIESQLLASKDVSPGIIFPKRPKDSARMKLIEQLFEKEGISVVWEDESITERKARS